MARDVRFLKGLALVSLAFVGMALTGCSSSDSDTPALPEDAPVLILLHGGTQNKTRVIDGTTGSSGWLSVAESEAVLLIVPNGTGADGDPNAISANWNDCRNDQVSGSSADDVAFHTASAASRWLSAR